MISQQAAKITPLDSTYTVPSKSAPPRSPPVTSKPAVKRPASNPIDLAPSTSAPTGSTSVTSNVAAERPASDPIETGPSNPAHQDKKQRVLAPVGARLLTTTALAKKDIENAISHLTDRIRELELLKRELNTAIANDRKWAEHFRTKAEQAVKKAAEVGRQIERTRLHVNGMRQRARELDREEEIEVEPYCPPCPKKMDGDGAGTGAEKPSKSCPGGVKK